MSVVNTSDLDVINHYVKSFEASKFADNKVRLNAKQALLDKGLPTKKDEQWQYTPLNSWANIRFTQTFEQTTAGEVSYDDVLPFLPSFNTFKLIFIDGVFNKGLSADLNNAQAGCIINLDAKNILLPTSTDTFQALFALNSNLTIDITIKEKVIIENPIHIIQVTTQQSMDAIGVKLNLETSAQCQLIQQQISLNGAVKFNNGYCAINLAKNALCQQYIVQNLTKESFYFNNQDINQASNSIFKTHYINLGSLVARNNNVVNFNGEHCESYQSSIVLADGKQIADSRTVTNHLQPHCNSYQLHKFVLDDYAQGIFNGMIFVAQDAQKTDGLMDNKNLLLSNTAKMFTKPQLEIYADDVLCSHGCTSGQIDENQLFYCQARGIRKEDALDLITQAFVLEPLDSINNQPIKKWLEVLINKELDNG